MTAHARRSAASLVLFWLAATAGAAQALDGLADRLPSIDVSELDAERATEVRHLHEAVAATLSDGEATPRERAEAAGELGRLYHAYGRLAPAVRCYELAREIEAEDHRWPYYLGVLHESAGRFEAAAAAYEASLTVRAEVPALLRLARVYDALGRPEAAERNRAQANRLAPGVEEANFPDPLIEGLVARAGERAHLLRGRIAFRQGRYEDAASAFTEALDANPESIAGLVNLGLTLSALGRAEEAITRWERAAEIAPGDPAPRLQLGFALAAQGELAAARTHLEAAVVLAPGDPTAHTELGAVHWHAGDGAKALEHYRRAIALDPNLERPRLGEAQVLQAMGRYDEALEHLEIAWDLLPSSGLVAYGLAWALATHPDPALRDGNRALGLAQGVFAARRRIEDAVLVAASLAALERCEDAARLLCGLAAAAGEADGGAETAEHLEARIALFEQGPPCLVPPSGRIE